MTADVLPSVLHDLRVEGSVYSRFAGRGAWAVRYAAVPGAAFHLVTDGACELRVSNLDGSERVHALAAGDFAVVSHGVPHLLASVGGACGCEAVDVADAVAGADRTRPAPLEDRGAEGEGAGYVCGSFRFAHRRPHPAIAALPEVLVVRGGRERADGGPLGPWLPTHLAAAACEAASGRPGADVVLARLSDVLFVHAIRAHLVDAPACAGAWVAALRDPAVSRALGLLHAHPERAWTVAGLAREVAMSRSRFAARFTALVGRPPLGYRSEAAFSHAFRRRVGAPPGAVRRRGARAVVRA